MLTRVQDGSYTLPTQVVYRTYANYTNGFDFIWNEIEVIITFEQSPEEQVGNRALVLINTIKS